MELTFEQQILLAVIGPVITVLAGGLVVGLIVRRTEDRHARERLNQELAAEDRRADNDFRQQSLELMTESAVSLYLETQHYWRGKREGVSGDERGSRRARLDVQYLATRRTGEILEQRLLTRFEDSNARDHWHAVMDLLTVRYFQVIDGPVPVAQNAGPNHSGLSETQLAIPRTVLDQYRRRLAQALASVTSDTLREPDAEATIPSSGHDDTL